jgi:hypothetical protein
MKHLVYQGRFAVVYVSDNRNIPDFLHVGFLKSGAKVRRDKAVSTEGLKLEG